MRNLLIFAVILLSICVFAEDVDSVKVFEEPELEIYYFHTSKRCGGCATIERLSEEVVTSNFADRLKTGEYAFIPVNVDKGENKHYISEYNIYTKQLILSGKNKDGERKWKNLEMIWKLHRNSEEFENYVVKEIEDFTKELKE